MIDLVRIAARLLLAWVFLRAGVDVLQHPESRVATASWLLDKLQAAIPFLPADKVLIVRTNAAVQVIAASLLALGQKPGLAALALAASLVPTSIGGHAFWRHDDPPRRAQQETHFNKNLAIIDGLLVAALETADRRRRG